MSVGYRLVQWSRPKVTYDIVALAAVVAFLGGYVVASSARWASPNNVGPEVMLLRSTGACAFALLHVVLALGPVARLWPRVGLPLMYNRRHLGVLTFLLALVHAIVAIGYYHGFGTINPLRSLLTSNSNFGSLQGFPFELLGLAGLMVLLVMAATSHDFWLRNLSSKTWKRLHVSVYFAYGLLVAHVALGALQGRGHLPVGLAVSAGAAILCVLHIAAGLRSRIAQGAQSPDGWLSIDQPETIPMNRARVIATPAGERIAVVRTQSGLSAVTNVCAHQGGPLGEGQVINDCLTCPWHGWQYRTDNGCSPPPFQERIKTYDLRVRGDVVEVCTQPNTSGTTSRSVVFPLNEAGKHDAGASPGGKQ